MGESIDINQILNNPGFKALGDPKEPATEQDIKEFL